MATVLTAPVSDRTPIATTPVVPNAVVDKKTWVAVVGACLGAFLAILNIQVVSSSLADIQGAIGTTPTRVAGS
jgi:DHA2 family multidrug resistance protein